ncbi:MAG: BTAD domain-containing putative transcriptional regulator [Candidatus Promineifilaceae bacterium]
MSVLHIQLLGGVQLVGPNDAAISLQPTVQNFLAYLLLHRHRHYCREVLSGLFWGERDESQARRCLSTTLWRLRQELEPEGTPRGTFVTTTHSGEIGFNGQSEAYWLDVAEFDTKVKNGLDCSPAEMGAAEARQLEEAAELYTGDLLEGFYDDWVLSPRERLRAQYINCLGRLMRYHNQNYSYERGIYYGRKILDMDPLREEIHREMMRLYDQNGERAQAVQQYEHCREILAEELDILPMPETQALYHQLASNRGQSILKPAATVGKGQPENLQQVLNQIDQALLNLEEVRGQLYQAKKAMTHFIDH